MVRRIQRNDELSEVHKQRIDRLVKRNAALKERVAAYEAQLGEGDDLLVRLAGALRVATDHATPAASSVPLNPDHAGGKPGPSEPSGGNRLARDAERGLRTTVERGLNTFDARVENGWRRLPRWDDGPKEDPWPSSVDKVRCGNRQCSRRGTRVAAYRVVEGELEVRWVCPECGSPYASHPLADSGGRS